MAPRRDERAEKINDYGLGVHLDLYKASIYNYRRGKGGMGGRIGKSILAEQALGDQEWLYSGIWAVARDSTNVASIRYLHKELMLMVMFKGHGPPTRLYAYYDVPKHIAQDFFLSNSLGEYVHSHLKGNYVTRQITY